MDVAPCCCYKWDWVSYLNSQLLTTSLIVILIVTIRNLLVDMRLNSEVLRLKEKMQRNSIASSSLVMVMVMVMVIKWYHKHICHHLQKEGNVFPLCHQVPWLQLLQVNVSVRDNPGLEDNKLILQSRWWIRGWKLLGMVVKFMLLMKGRHQQKKECFLSDIAETTHVKICWRVFHRYILCSVIVYDVLKRGPNWCLP